MQFVCGTHGQGNYKAILEDNTTPVLALAFLSDARDSYENVLASGSLDGTIQLWKIAPVPRSADVNGDGIVNILDLTFITSHVWDRVHRTSMETAS